MFVAILLRPQDAEEQAVHSTDTRTMQNMFVAILVRSQDVEEHADLFKNYAHTAEHVCCKFTQTPRR
jgi:hypothetical protein